MTPLEVECAAFRPGAAIPARYSYGGGNLSPPLAWSAVPIETRSIAVLCEDADAPSADTPGAAAHWVLYDLGPDSIALAEGVPHVEVLPSGACQGLNHAGYCGYVGPDPPPGELHRYRFTVLALDTMLSLPSHTTGGELWTAMNGHILASGTLIGLSTVGDLQ